MAGPTLVCSEGTRLGALGPARRTRARSVQRVWKSDPTPLHTPAPWHQLSLTSTLESLFRPCSGDGTETAMICWALVWLLS